MHQQCRSQAVDDSTACQTCARVSSVRVCRRHSFSRFLEEGLVRPSSHCACAHRGYALYGADVDAVLDSYAPEEAKLPCWSATVKCGVNVSSKAKTLAASATQSLKLWDAELTRATSECDGGLVMRVQYLLTAWIDVVR